MNLTDKGNKGLWFFLKLIIVFGCFYYLAIKLGNNSFSYTKFQASINQSNLALITCVLLIMPINWIIESAKWKILVQQLENLSWSQAIIAVLSGTSSAIITPNRIGEFMGKTYFLSSKNKIQGASLSLLGSFIQLLITISLGTFSVIYLYLSPIPLINTPLLIFCLVVCIISCSILLISNRYLKFLPEKYHYLTQSLLTLNNFQKISVVLLSFIRYLIFSFQFYLLLVAFGTNISLQNAMISIPLIYYSTALIPSISFAELGIREITSVEILQYFCENPMAIVYSTFTLWLINLLLPAVVGSYFLLKPIKN